MMKLSENFSLREFTRSATATSMGISNEPTEEHLENMKKLCENVLQPLREHIGVSIRLTSGYRSVALNKALRGSSTSDHCYGRAADIELWINGEEDSAKLFYAIKELDLPFYQMIWEFGTDEQPDWVHIAYREGNDKKQCLVAYKDENNNTKYRQV